MINSDRSVNPIGGPANAFMHVRTFPTADLPALVRPNFDTLYFGFGRQNQSAWLSTALSALTLALALGLVLDLDRPQRGLTRVDLSAMRTTQQQLETTQH